MLRHYFSEGEIMQQNNNQTISENPPPPPSVQKKKWYKTWWGILLIVFVYIPIGLTVFTVVFAISSDSENESTQRENSTTKNNVEYEIKIAGNTYADDNNRRLTFTVKNLGSSDVWPACYIKINSPDKRYISQDYVTWNTPLAPGDTKYFEGLMPVKDQGARYATLSDVSCSTDPLH